MKQTTQLWLAATLATACLPAHAETPAPVPSPQALVDALEGTNGVHPGARRNHAKGVCATGYFMGTAEGQSISSASAFSGQRIPMVARFSVGGGNPQPSEKTKTVRGLALQFNLPNDEKWMMANISAPVFFVATPQNVVLFLESRKPDPETKKPDPAKVSAFNAANPDTKPQIEFLAKAGVPASYAGLSYFSTHAFKFTNSGGKVQYAKWMFEPVAGQERLTDEQLKQLPDSFLNDELRRRVAAKPVEYLFRLQLAEADDSLVNPTIQWPDSRKVVTAGRLVIDKVEADAAGACKDITFNPQVLPKGIELSADPVLQARSTPYVISQSKRLSGK